jgi:hypothetical protein
MNVADSSTTIRRILQEDHAGLPTATAYRHLVTDGEK